MARRSRLTQLNSLQYDALERAIADGRRLSVWRNGTEFIIVVDRLRVAGGREALEAHHPTTGDKLHSQVRGPRRPSAFPGSHGQ